MRHLNTLVVGLFLLVFSLPVQARDFVFHEFVDSLARTDVVTGEIEIIGPLSRTIVSLDFGPDGRLFGIAGTPTALVEIDTRTAQITDIGSFPGLPVPFVFNGPWRLTITESGRFFLVTIGMGEGSILVLWELDPLTSAATRVGGLPRFVNGFTSRGEQLLGLSYLGPSAGDWEVVEISSFDASITPVVVVGTNQFQYFDDADVDDAGRLVIYGETIGMHDPDMLAIDVDTGVQERLFPGFTYPPVSPQVLAVRGAQVTEIPTLGSWGVVLLVALLAAVAVMALRRRELARE